MRHCWEAGCAPEGEGGSFDTRLMLLKPATGVPFKPLFIQLRNGYVCGASVSYGP